MPPRNRGFTLIELLIVIGILALLAAVLLPNVLGAQREGEIADTQARLLFLEQAAAAFERKHGRYPPDRFEDLGLAVRVDQENTGIEALVIALCEVRLSRDSIADHADWLANTDGDQAGVVIPLLDRQDKMEVVDAWGTPLAYFCSHNGGYDRRQRIRPPAGEVVTAQARRDPNTGKLVAPGKFQILSAGADLAFGTDDDVGVPSVARE